MQVQWEYEGQHNRYLPYPAEVNIKLEKARNTGKDFVEWKEEEANGNVRQWVVDLKNLVETDGNTNQKVHRRTLEEKGNFKDLSGILIY